MSFLEPYIYFIALSFVASLTGFFIQKNNLPILKYFTPFLFLTLIAEVYGSYLSSIGKNNAILYNFFSTFEFCFYFFIISRLISSVRMRKTIRSSIIIYVFVALINIFFIQGLYRFHTVTYSLGCLMIVVFCIYYFLELFRHPKSEKLYTNPAFWICAALLFFYCCGFPLYGLIIYWDQKMPKLMQSNLISIFAILNISLYTLFTIAFLCNRKKKYTLSQ